MAYRRSGTPPGVYQAREQIKTKEGRPMIADQKEASLDQIKRSVSILVLAASSGFAPKKISQGEYVVRCPSKTHEDKTPSCHINTSKNLFHCKGCGVSGSVVDWLMITDEIDEASAIRYLKEGFSRFIENKGNKENKESKKKIEIVPEKEPPLSINDPLAQKALGYLCDYYHKSFKQKKEGGSYLIKRGLVFGELVEQFTIGYADGSLAESLNDTGIVKVLESFGVITRKKDGGFIDNFSGRVVFPVFDENGLITQIYGRSITNSATAHLLLSGVPLSLFNPKALNSSEIILCESIIDALSVMAMGYRNVIAALSVNGLKEDLFKKITAGEIKRVYIAFDNDPAGNIAAGSQVDLTRRVSPLSERLIEHRVESYRITFDENSDANDLLIKFENIKEAAARFKELVENARPIKQIIDTVQTEGYHADVLEKKGKEYLYKTGQRQYTIRGLDQNKTDSALKIFLRLDYTQHQDTGAGQASGGSGKTRFHIDNNLDLFNAKNTGIFCRSAAAKLTLEERVVSADLDNLTMKLDELLKRSIEEKEAAKQAKKKEFHKNLETSYKAREFLSDPLFITRFVNDMEKAGVVGERLNMFFGFLSTLSRYMKYPLHLIIQSESSAGKSNMLNLLSKLVPEETMIYLTQVTPRSFYYGEEDYLKNKSIFIAEADGLKEAEFPIKQMMSEGRLAISSTRTDPKTGEHTTDNRQIEGPSQFVITEPVESLNEEITNRCVTLVLDMSLKQTERIMEYQRLLHSPDGVNLRKQKELICDFYRHVQREVLPMEIINPYSRYLSFNARSHQARRDHQKYLTLLDCITLLFQHQREKTPGDTKFCIKTHPIDIELCNYLSKFIFSHSFQELPPQTVNFLNSLIEYILKVSKENEIDFDQIWFYRKEARHHTGLSNTRVHEHINRLVDHEILASRRDQNGISYRFLLQPSDDGTISHDERLKLVKISEILKHATKKERQEYTDFHNNLKSIFVALDPEYKGEVA